MRTVVIAGGGTGGHIFPALAIAERLKQEYPDTQIYFVGADSGMETRLIPSAGFPIETLPIAGIQRQLTLSNIWKNLQLPYKIWVSNVRAAQLLKKWKPGVVIGVGGYASYPMVRTAQRNHIPTILCEQNAIPGLVTKQLSSRATVVLLGNRAAGQYLKAKKVVVTGNPLRKAIIPLTKTEACTYWGFDPEKPVVFITGGSLGAKTINDATQTAISEWLKRGLQVIWQCGRSYYPVLEKQIPAHAQLKLLPFVEAMGAAYGAADLVVARAGALTLAELAQFSIPAILIPSPYVANDHQTFNAKTVVALGAAKLVPDAAAIQMLKDSVLSLLIDQPHELQQLKKAATTIEKTDAAGRIVAEIIHITDKNT